MGDSSQPASPASSPAPSPAASPAGTAPPRKRRGLRLVLKLLVLLLLLLGLAPLALRLGFVRDFVASKASQALGAPVSIGSASAWWTSGIDLTDVTVGSPPGHDGPLAKVERVHVKVGLGGLLSGNLAARVDVTRPLVTLRRNAAGRWNTDDLGKQDDARKPAQARKDGPGPRVDVEIVDGVLEAHGVGTGVERIKDIDLTAHLAPDGALSAVLGLLAEKAGLGGQDARISFEAAHTPGTPSPFEAHIPSLDLARLAGLLEGVSGLRAVAGTTSLEAKGTLDEEGHVAGTLRLAGQGLTASTADGAVLRLAKLSGTVEASQGAAGEGAKGDLLLEGLEVLSGVEAGAPTLREPEVRARFDAVRALDGRLTLSVLDVSAGQALRLRATTPLVVVPGDAGPLQVTGDAEINADLARLSALKAFVPALDSLTSGLLVASVRGRPGPGLDLAMGARLTNLVLAPGALVEQGLSDPDITLQAGAQRAPDGALTLQVFALSSQIARLKSAQPFVVRRAADGGLSFSGPLDLALDLGRLSRAFGGALGLEAGASLAGSLAVLGNATGGPDAGRLDAQVTGAGLLLPPAWSANRTPGPFAGKLGLVWTREGLEVEMTGLRGLGVAGDGKAQLTKRGEALGLSTADVRVEADLAQLRAWYGPLMLLAPEAELAGRGQATLRVTEPAGVLRVEGRVQVAALAYRASREAALLEEPAFTLEHAWTLPSGAAPLKLDVLKLSGNGYQLDLSGSSLGGGDDAFDLKGTLKGDAAQLATRVRAFLGESMQDLQGRGQVDGRFAFQGRGDALLEGATATADLTLGTWSTSGALFEGARITLARPAAGAPYDVRLTSGLNGGTADVAFGINPRAGRMPWTLATTLRGVDTSTWLTTGAGFRRLAYVLPTLVPIGAETPALSGKLDATLEARAADLAAPDLQATLVGKGTLALTQGTLGQSTLFGALAAGGSGGGGLGEVGKVLTQVAPEVGKTLAGLTRAVAFQEITSRFTIGAGRVDIEEARMLAPEHRLELKGPVTFEQRADLAARLWLGGKAGDELKRTLPDQTIPLRIRGPLEKPQVLPDLQASDLLKGALPTPKDILKDPKGALDDVKKLKDRWKDLLPR